MHLCSVSRHRMFSLISASALSLPRIRSSLYLSAFRNLTAPSRVYFAKKAKAVAPPPAEEPTMESYRLDPYPEVDLSTVCYGLNYLTEGEEVKLKDPSEYPDWLWTLLDPVPQDPSNTTYARRMRKQANRNRQKEIIYNRKWRGWKKYYPTEED